MAIAAKDGFIADFKIGYLQREIAIHQCAVTGGTDVSFGGDKTGYAVGRLVKIEVNTDGLSVISQPTEVTATSISDANYIIAQSDDTLRNTSADVIPVERYCTRSRGILANTITGETTLDAANLEHSKTVAVWKITNSDDVLIIPVAPATNSVIR